jgi:hypothetical protein
VLAVVQGTRMRKLWRAAEGHPRRPWGEFLDGSGSCHGGAQLGSDENPGKKGMGRASDECKFITSPPHRVLLILQWPSQAVLRPDTAGTTGLAVPVVVQTPKWFSTARSRRASPRRRKCPVVGSCILVAPARWLPPGMWGSKKL